MKLSFARWFNGLGINAKLLGLCLLLATIPILLAGTFVISFVAGSAESQARAQLADKLDKAELILSARRGEVERNAAVLSRDNLITVNLDLGLESPVRDYLAERRSALALDFLGVLGPDGQALLGSSKDGLFEKAASLLPPGLRSAAETGGSLPFTLQGPGEGISSGFVSRILTDQGRILGYLMAGDLVAPGSDFLKRLSAQVGAYLRVVPGGKLGPEDFVREDRGGEAWLFTYAGLGEGGDAGTLGVGIRKADYLAGRNQTILGFVAIFLAAGLASCFLGLFFSQSITHRVRSLVEGTERIAGGNFGEAIPVSQDDELGALARSFNAMAARLGESRRELRDLNEELELRIAERTSELSATNEELGATISNLEATMAQLVESEKMASLGQLVASIAHELNTPLGAISSANDGSDDQLRKVLGGLPALMASLAGADAQAFAILLQKALEPHPLRSETSSDRALRRAIERKLDASGVADSGRVADELSEMGIPDPDSALIAALAGPRGREMIEFAGAVAWLIRSREIIAVASEKAAKTILALKTYSHTDTADQGVDIDIPVELDTILDLYYGKTKNGVEVVRSYSAVPRVRGRRDKLNQVWVNLINNSLQAMDYKGILGLSVTPISGAVEVAVSDTGPGVPAHIADHIFDAFFTTKRPGEGSGLGLSICQKIVTAHGGTISFESVPGRTVFVVRLPLGKPSSTA